MTNFVWILGDQLLKAHPAIAAAQVSAEPFRVLLIESAQITRRLPYHRAKLTLIFSAMRHYAERLRAEGLIVDLLQADSMRAGLTDYAKQHKPAQIFTMAASDFSGRDFQTRQLAAFTSAEVVLLPNTQFLIGQHDPFPAPKAKVILETFYRAMRRHFAVLMDGDQPLGGQWNFDHDNRKPLPKSGLTIPDLPTFPPDAITGQVQMELRERGIGISHGDAFSYAVTHADAERALDDFIVHRLPWFGDFEDAMTIQHRTLFHSVLSPYVNIGLLEPMHMIRAAEQAYHDGVAPLNAVEGFIRQVLGWREYMAWQYWRQMPDLRYANAWDAQRAVPPFFWTAETEMACLRHALTALLDTGYTHHIERLMLISNFFMLFGVAPQAAVRWFNALYIDAYDWVMQSNVVGMGLNADGGQIATKPYIASANYINKMGDACAGCRFNPKVRTGDDACPYNFLYWNFLIKHEERLRKNPRSGPAVLGLKHLDADERKAVQQQAAAWIALTEGTAS